MSRRSVRWLVALILLCGGWGEFSTGARLFASLCGVAYATGAVRGSASPVIVRSSYDYAPSILKDGSLYRMWWCGGVAGDHVMYAESTSLDSGWSTPVSAFTPTYVFGTFDEQHTCDPSVIRVGGTWYLYYSAAEAEGHPGVTPITRIGLATSTNGVTWTRANSGLPIISPRQPGLGGYGAGQQTVTYVNGLFYIRFTDTTGLDGPGQYIMRSPEPTFQSAVEEFRGPGIFNAYSAATHTSNMFFASHSSGYSSDMQYIDATDQFAMADAPADNQIRISLYNSQLSRKEGEVFINLTASWQEGPGIVSSPDRHAVPSPSCGVIPFDIVREVGADIGTGDLAHAGVDWNTGLPCDCTSAPTLNQPGFNTMGDFTGDNRDDLTSHHRTSGAFTIRANLGGSFAPDGTFAASGTTPSSSAGWETLAADFDGDGYADFADRHIPSGQVWVHRNLHNGTFDGNTWAFGYSATGPNMEVMAGDLSGDGKADLIEHNRKTGQFWVRVNSGAGGTFVPQDVGITFRSQAGAGGQDWRAVVADFNGDGTVDIADLHVPSFQFWVHPATGGYQFSAGSWSAVQAFVWSGFTPVFGDFDGDNWTDYADVNRNSGEIWVHRSNQNQTFDQVNVWEYGVFSLGTGGRWILGVPVSFP
jgi:hypothetical protein